jgi:DNA-binding MarR family transcriptional regulator
MRASIPFLVGKLFRQLARVHGRAVKRFEVSAVQANVLAVLWLEGTMTIGELQSTLALGSSTLTGAVDRMESAGLVKRMPVAGDRRAFRLEPAAWPAKKKDGLLEALAQADRACFAELTTAERAELVRLLTKAVGAMEHVEQGDDESGGD